MLRVLSPQLGGLLDVLTWAALPLLGYWRRLPTAVMMRRRQRRKKSCGPARPCCGLATRLLAHLEAPEKGEDFAAGPAASQGPAPRQEGGENSGGYPRAPSVSHDQEEGASRGEGPERHGEEATARLEMEEHLEEVEDVPTQTRDDPSGSPQDRKCHGAGGKPEGGLKPPGEDAPSCPQGGTDPGHPVTGNPLVLSLFYCPSEEEEAGDWPSEEEGDDGGGCSGTDWTDSEEELEDDAWREENEALWGALCRGQDPFNPLRLARAPLGPTPPRRKDQEFRVSFYLCGSDSEAEKVGDPWKPPEKPWPMRRSVPGRPHCCELGSRGARDPVKAETSDSEGNRTAKKVRFSPVVTVHPLLVWPFASWAARRGPWEELARDRSRFRRRIEQLGAILGPCLEPGHRARAWRKIHGAAPELAGQETPFPLHEGKENPGQGQGMRDMSLQLCCERMEDPGVREGQAGKHTPLPSAYRGVEDPGIRDGRLG
ncbi:protein phosphatase 1 regulatory subunit 15A [Terrapene carolina triunguis]|uniref:Protein phosphatase 1 regulatory subunit 15A n=1 Tax=Terrapene triunguis TaxID=2587831 RepID=A0A674IC24_9SAUR|nr:protein phosphatase 1 regulatory subunit 15A [Terrapene carolina triunguis]